MAPTSKMTRRPNLALLDLVSERGTLVDGDRLGPRLAALRAGLLGSSRRMIHTENCVVGDTWSELGIVSLVESKFVLIADRGVPDRLEENGRCDEDKEQS